MKIPLVYALHSGNLYGTERMALHTARALISRFDPVIMAPPGPALEEAKSLGYGAIPFEGAMQFSSAIRQQLAKGGNRLAFLATAVMHSAVCIAWNKLYRRRIAHVQMVHGGAAEALSYGRKAWLNGHPVEFVAVSSYVRERLVSSGVNLAQIRVIENFLPDPYAVECPRRAPFQGEPIRRLIVVSRLDPEKRVDLLLQALESAPDAGQFEVRVYGTGWDTDKLKARVANSKLKVVFAGFSNAIKEALAGSDLLVHLCPVEPFGLAIIEAMAAGIPALVPDAGGAGSLVENEVSGFRFHANESASLVAKLREIAALPAERLNGIVAEGRRLLETRFSQTARTADYINLLMESLE